MSLRSLGLTASFLYACTSTTADDSTPPVVELSEAAQPIFDLMQWTGVAVPAACDDANVPTGIDPAADPAAVEAAATALAGDILTELTFDPPRGRLQVSTVEREIMRGPDMTDEQLLRDSVTAVVAAMGNTDDELALEISGTTVAGGDPPTAEMLDKSVQFQRSVLGLSVGDNGRASFEMTGALISMQATWRRFDYDASTLCVDGIATDDAVMAALAEMLAADGFEIQPTTVGFEVGTYYRPMDPIDPSSDTWTLRLVGYAALIDSRGGTIPTYAYYLDDGVSLAD